MSEEELTSEQYKAKIAELERNIQVMKDLKLSIAHHGIKQ